MSLRSISFMSYAMHTVVAVAAVLPGVQASVSEFTGPAWTHASQG